MRHRSDWGLFVSASSWEPGTVIAEKYRLESKLGQGGMGTVWRAHHLALRSPVAIKLMDAAIAANPEALARFMREAQAAAALRSAHVVQTFDYGADGSAPYIVMEMLEGESLADRVERVKVLPPVEIAQIMTHVARAVGKGHDNGIIHRDLKPDNIFICHNDDEEVAKVLDFGIAKAAEGALGLSSGSTTRTGALLGTPYYMSPEQAQGNKSVDWRSDLWSMAVITFECTLGFRPFDSDGLGDLIMRICAAPLPVPSTYGQVPPGFDEWWARAADRDPAQRYQSAKELAEALRLVLTGSRTRFASVQGIAPPSAIAHPSTPHPGTPHPETPAAQATTGSAHVNTPSPMSRSTAELATAGVPAKRGGAGALIAVGGLAAIGLVGAGAFFALKSGDDASQVEDSVTPAAAEAPPEEGEKPSTAPAPDEPAVDVASAADDAGAKEPAEAAKPAKPKPVVAARKLPLRPVGKPKPPAPKVAPPPPKPPVEKAPPKKKKRDLGF